MSVPFRERNPVPIGIAGILALVLLLYAGFNAANLPFIGGGDDYVAHFSDAAGLRPDDGVRIAGVNVGTVRSLDIDNGQVVVHFRVAGGTKLGDKTRAEIKLKTLLGQKFVMLYPSGQGSLGPNGIPIDRTSAPLDVPQAFGDLSRTIGEIDTAQLAKSFQVIADTFQNTPGDVKTALTGLQRLSETISSRDQQIGDLLARARGVSSTLADRNGEITKLINDGDVLLRAIEARRAAIHNLLVATSTLSAQLVGLVRDNQAQIGPALANLRGTVSILQKNEANLDKTITLLAPFLREFSDTLGNGRWFDTVVRNLGTQSLADACVGTDVVCQLLGTAAPSGGAR